MFASCCVIRSIWALLFDPAASRVAPVDAAYGDADDMSDDTQRKFRSNVGNADEEKADENYVLPFESTQDGVPAMRTL